MCATAHELNANILFELSDLPTEGWLRSVELLLGGDGQTARVGHGDEVAWMPELHHRIPYLISMGPAYKVFSNPTGGVLRASSRRSGAVLTIRLAMPVAVDALDTAA
jgi:hypothetical protein